MTVLTLLINIVMAALLAVTIAYCWVLNRRIKILQDGKGELAQLLKHFDESTLRASESIIALQTASKKIGETIQARIDKANYVLDDLSFMLEKGNKLANQLEASAAVSRARSRVDSGQEPSSEELPHESATPADIKPMPVLERSSSREKTAASLEVVLERMIGRAKPTAPAAAAPEEKPRSRSEQELLNMLRAGCKG